LPEGETIGVNVFNSCDGLTGISLPLAESIGSKAFYGCKSFVSIMLGKDPPVLGDQTFTSGRPAYIYIPEAGRETYEETGEGGWTDALKAKIRSLPE
jgi:hypothetical protein